MIINLKRLQKLSENINCPEVTRRCETTVIHHLYDLYILFMYMYMSINLLIFFKSTEKVCKFLYLPKIQRDKRKVIMSGL